MTHGFKFEPTAKDNWIRGSGKATKKFGARPLVFNGHGWGGYLPKSEKQSREFKFESMACTVYGSLNALETLANRLGYDDFPKNCAERFSAIMAEVTPEGNSPHKSLEAIRNFGVIQDSVLPFTDDIESWDEYYSPNPMTYEYIKLAESILRKFEIGHEYLFNGSDGRDRPTLLIDGLTRGTVCISVDAWNKKGDMYVKKGDDNHWVMLVDYKDGEYWEVEDSYNPFTKKIPWDTDFQTAKVLFLQRNATGKLPREKSIIIQLIRQLIPLLRELIKLKQQIGVWLGFKR